MGDTNNAITKIIGDYLHTQKITKTQLGKQIGLSPSGIGGKLSGARKWTLQDVDNLTRAGVLAPILGGRDD